MALTDPVPDTESAETGDPAQPLDFSPRDLGLRLVLLGSPAPATGFSACRTGLVSDLLLRCGEGDSTAFEAVVDIFYSVIAAATAQHLPPGEVEAAVRRTFTTIWRRSVRYRPGGMTAVEWIMGHVVTARSEVSGADL
jgi:hypothetical protein